MEPDRVLPVVASIYPQRPSPVAWRPVGRTKQMGPALLPTPLSPARGLVIRRTFRTSAWRPMFPRPSPKGRSVPSPALAPASGFARGLTDPKTGPRLARPKPGYPWWPSISNGIRVRRSVSRIPSMSGRIARRWRNSYRAFLERTACLRPKPLSCVPRTARGIFPLPHRVPKSPSFSGLSTVDRRAFLPLPMG